MSHKVLYITYDGLLDQLGQSQILPYLYKLSEKNHHMHIVSFEKSIHTKAEIENLKSDLKSKNINWDFLRFTSNPKLNGKIWDLIKFFIKILLYVRTCVLNDDLYFLRIVYINKEKIKNSTHTHKEPPKTKATLPQQVAIST